MHLKACKQKQETVKMNTAIILVYCVVTRRWHIAQEVTDTAL